jgi:hypothetical protein
MEVLHHNLMEATLHLVTVNEGVRDARCPDVDGGQNIGKVFKPAMEVWPPLIWFILWVEPRG